MFRTVLANISRRKLRMLATSLAVLLGVMFTSGTLVLTDTLGATFDRLFDDRYSQVSAVVRSSQNIEGGIELSLGNTRSDLPAEMVDELRDVPGVAAASGSLTGYTQIILRNKKALGNPNQGPPTIGAGWTSDPGLNPFEIIEGHAPETADEVVIDPHTASKSHYGVGDKIPLLTPSGRVTKTVVGIARASWGDSAMGTTMVLFTTAEAQKVLLRPGMFEEVLLEAKPGVSPHQLVNNVEGENLSDAEVLTGTKAAEEAKDDATAFLSFFSVFLLVFAAIALLVGGFIIANTFSILVAQRTRELALLRAVGASRRQVVLSVVAEAAVVGILASVVGLALGFGIAAGLQYLFLGSSDLVNAPTLTLRTTLLSFVIGVGITVLSALLPARRAARVPPVTAMREAAVEDTSRGRVRTIIGLVLAAVSAALLILAVVNQTQPLVGVGAVVGLIAAVLLGPALASAMAVGGGRLLARFGMPGKLGQQNVLRNPKRTASTASALMIGATLVCAIAVFAASAVASINNLVDTHFHGSVVVSSTGMGLPMSDVDRLKDESLGPTAAMSFAPVELDGHGEFVSGSDPVTLTKLIDMETVEGSVADLGPDDIAISQAKADKEGWKIGTSLDAEFLKGSEKKLTVRAIYQNRLVAQDIFAQASTIEASMLAPVAQIVFIGGSSDVTPEQLKTTVDKMLEDNPTAKVQTNAEFRDSSAAQMNSFLKIVYALLALAVLIALIGIVNTLALSIMERVTELGLLRAVGMTKRQLRTTVRIEALLIAVTGTVIGIVLGTAIGASLMKSFGPEQALTGFAIPVLTLVVVLVAGVAVGFIAAILPARRAAKLDPLDALAAD